MLIGVHDKSVNQCSECELKSSFQNPLALHTEEEHTIEILSCSYCVYKTEDESIL